jgi:hypothetical protein
VRVRVANRLVADSANPVEQTRISFRPGLQLLSSPPESML